MRAAKCHPAGSMDKQEKMDWLSLGSPPKPRSRFNYCNWNGNLRRTSWLIGTCGHCPSAHPPTPLSPYSFHLGSSTIVNNSFLRDQVCSWDQLIKLSPPPKYGGLLLESDQKECARICYLSPKNPSSQPQLTGWSCYRSISIYVFSCTVEDWIVFPQKDFEVLNPQYLWVWLYL